VPDHGGANPRRTDLHADRRSVIGGLIRVRVHPLAGCLGRFDY
jgi:hypothetical protein